MFLQNVYIDWRYRTSIVTASPVSSPGARAPAQRGRLLGPVLHGDTVGIDAVIPRAVGKKKNLFPVCRQRSCGTTARI